MCTFTVWNFILFCANLLLLRLRRKIKTGAFEFLLLDFVRSVLKRTSFWVYLIAVVLCILNYFLSFFYLRRKPAAPGSFAASAMGKQSLVAA